MKIQPPLHLRVRLDETVSMLQQAIISIKIDLRSFEETELRIKNNSMLKVKPSHFNSSHTGVKHFEIPFTVCMSTENE